MRGQVGLPLFEVKLDAYDCLTYVLMDNSALVHYESTNSALTNSTSRPKLSADDIKQPFVVFGLKGDDPFYSRRNANAAWTIQRAFRCYRARKVPEPSSASASAAPTAFSCPRPSRPPVPACCHALSPVSRAASPRLYHHHHHHHDHDHVPGVGAVAVRGVGTHPRPARLAPRAPHGHQHHLRARCARSLSPVSLSPS